MSACRVCGDGPEVVGGDFCAAHVDAWWESPERQRWQSFHGNHPGAGVAVMDFINRARAERQNGAKT